VENILLNIFFMQLSKRETHAYTARLPFHILEMHHYHACLPSPLIGDVHTTGVSHISLQREMSS
jgi:hypothetical protein